jgi:outer membrane protein assembly factor BamB
LTLFDGLVYVPTASFCDQPDSIGHAPDGRLVAVDANQARARTGAELWTRWLGAPLYTPPIFAEGRVVAATMGGQVYAFDLRHG